MATTVTWDGLRDLAGFRAQSGCAISLNLDLDPSVTPTAADAATRVNALLDEIERSEAARRPELTHEQKEGLRNDVQRLREFFAQEFDRDGTHGFAVFCASLDNLWQPLPLSARVPDVVKVGRTLYLAPLVSLVGRGEGALVVFVGRERGDLYRLRAGRLEELVDQFDEAPLLELQHPVVEKVEGEPDHLHQLLPGARPLHVQGLEQQIGDELGREPGVLHLLRRGRPHRRHGLPGEGVGLEGAGAGHQNPSSVHTIVSPSLVRLAASVPAGSSRASRAELCQRVRRPGRSSA